MNKWEDYILYGGDMPVMNVPEVNYPHGYKGCKYVKGILMHAKPCTCDPDDEAEWHRLDREQLNRRLYE